MQKSSGSYKIYGSIYNFHLSTCPGLKFLMVGHLNMNNTQLLFSETLQYFMRWNETGVEINSR